jgi:hypothetical protein
MVTRNNVKGRLSTTLFKDKERRRKVFENRVLKRIFGPKKDGIVREWRKLHNVELSNLYTWPRMIKSRRMRWAGNVARNGENRILV